MSDRRNLGDIEMVTIGFQIGKYPVTNQEYAVYLEANPDVEKPEFWDNPKFNTPRQPVVGVSWNDAQAFCEWADCRLPTEVEWEYACRAGTATKYSFGDNVSLLGEYAWFDENSNGQTQLIGLKKPNPWGLYDMHGNVWEWCEDTMASSRVFRGGCWYYTAEDCRSSIRDWGLPEYRLVSLGFRLARNFKTS